MKRNSHTMLVYSEDVAVAVAAVLVLVSAVAAVVDGVEEPY